jgi:hypothetical protein
VGTAVVGALALLAAIYLVQRRAAHPAPGPTGPSASARPEALLAPPKLISDHGLSLVFPTEPGKQTDPRPSRGVTASTEYTCKVNDVGYQFYVSEYKKDPSWSAKESLARSSNGILLTLAQTVGVSKVHVLGKESKDQGSLLGTELRVALEPSSTVRAWILVKPPSGNDPPVSYLISVTVPNDRASDPRVDQFFASLREG